MSSGASPRAAVLGAGSIGVAFAISFARAGRSVAIWDPITESIDRARAELLERLEGLVRQGSLESAESVLDLVQFEGVLGDAVGGADLVQECAPERLEIKRSLFADLAGLLGASSVLASSSSAITATRSGAGLEIADRLLVGHPGNPPYLLPVIEVAPSPLTRGDIVESAQAFYAGCGLRPVLVHGEPEGFVYNRLQGALLREAYCLVRDGVADVESIDAIVRLGLGRRWSVIGPFETVDLNTRGGIVSHAEKMGPAYARMGAERGQHDPWTPELVADVARQRAAAIGATSWEERVRWRDEELAALAAHFESRG